MSDFHVYSPEDAIVSNLKETSRRLDMVAEQELSHLEELAEEIAKLGDITVILQTLPDRRPPSFSPDEAVLPESRPLLSLSKATQQTVRSVLLCRALYRKLSKKKHALKEHFFGKSQELSQESKGRIAYQKSSYADSAFLQLTQKLSEARAVYAPSFAAACEEVYNGQSEYCILPIENTSEGQLLSFYRLIERYELKIILSCDIRSGESGRSTRFALLGRKLLPAFENTKQEFIFEISLPLGAYPETADLLLSAQLCGLSLRRISTLPAEEDVALSFSVLYSFLASTAELNSFLLYLAMEAPQATHLGLYPNLNKRGI